MFQSRLMALFLGTAAFYTISSRLWEKHIETRASLQSTDQNSASKSVENEMDASVQKRWLKRVKLALWHAERDSRLWTFTWNNTCLQLEHTCHWILKWVCWSREENETKFETWLQKAGVLHLSILHPYICLQWNKPNKKALKTSHWK